MSYTGGTTSWEFRGAEFAKQLYFSPRNCSKLSSPSYKAPPESNQAAQGFFLTQNSTLVQARVA